MTGLRDSPSNPHGAERRIGARYPLGHDVTFQPQMLHKKKRKMHKARAATVVDFSLTGLLLRTAADKDIERGTQALINADGMRCVVQVERIQTTEDPNMMLYGVQFLSIDAEFERLIGEAVASPGTTANSLRD
jgi:PilZ domain